MGEVSTMHFSCGRSQARNASVVRVLATSFPCLPPFGAETNQYVARTSAREALCTLHLV